MQSHCSIILSSCSLSVDMRGCILLGDINLLCLMFFLQVSTKELVAQNIVTHEAIYNPSKILDQFGEGLKKLPAVYQLMKAFPDLFLPLFTYSGNIEAEDVIDALFVPKDTIVEKGLLQFLEQYLLSCSQEGMPL